MSLEDHNPQPRAITIRAVAAEAGVSTATVSRFLTDPNTIGKPTRQRVAKAVEILDYHPNRLARRLRAGQSKVVGVIIPDLQNPFLTGVVHGIESVLYKAGYTLILGHSDGIVSRESAHFAILRGEGAAGLILIPDNGPGANYKPLLTWGIPVVSVDRVPEGIEVDLVCTNHREGARDAIQHLMSHGYKEIALINGPFGFSVTQERLAGYEEALARGGIRTPDTYKIHSDFRQAGGKKAMTQLLDLPKPPRAVLVGNNLMTLGAFQAIHERGIRVPEDIAVIGFDDMPWASSLRPALTAVAQPVEELGQIAAETLLKRLASPTQLFHQVILPPRLILRASCGHHAASAKSA